ncbi:hypothetical protein D3C72_2144230 [compost metagenome]
MGVEVGLRAEVATVVEGGDVGGFAVLLSGVSGAGVRPANAHADLLAHLFGHAVDVDRAEELTGFLHAGFQGLGDAGGGGEFGGDVGYAV